MDRWILSEVNQLVNTVDKGLSAYEITDTARSIEKFTDMLSNWYVRRCRERYWGSEWTADKQAAYVTLYTVLDTLVKVAAPFVPFITESIYQNITANFFADAPRSVHLCDFPKADQGKIDEKLNADMEKVLDVVVLGRSARNAANVKNRQPLSVMYVSSSHPFTAEMTEIVKNELNVKEVRFIEDAGAFSGYEIKPQLKTLGPKYGKLIGAIRSAFATLDGATAKEMVEKTQKGETYVLNVEGNDVQLTADDLLVSTKNKQGYSVASDYGDSVALDVTVTPQLAQEGLVREVISKIQTMRKECGFVVTDHVDIGYDGDEEVCRAISDNVEEISRSTLARSVVRTSVGKFVKQWEVNGKNFTLCLSKA